jgi:glycosyltransferase involved in cell wall biosynthesis
MTTTAKKVLVRGPVLTRSGYGTHARQVVRHLFNLQDSGQKLDIYFDVLPWGNTPWMLNPNHDKGLTGRILGFTDHESVSDYDVSIQIQLPNEWDVQKAKYNIGITAGVETTLCNPKWIEAINKMDLVIAPSEFTKTTFMNSGKVTTEIRVVPESFIDEILDDNVQPLELKEVESAFNFLVFGQVTGNNPENERKNLFYTMKWFCEVFANNPNAGLIINTNCGRKTVIDKVRTQKLLKEVLLNAGYNNVPKVYLLHGEMSNEDVAGLYKSPKIKAFLTLSRGEGFNIPALEAAASGLPVIATNWSAHTEFLSLGKFSSVEKTLVPIHESRVDNNIFMAGSKWAAPSEEDAKRRMRKMHESPSVPRQWAADLQKVIREQYSFEAISKSYKEALLGVFD